MHWGWLRWSRRRRRNRLRLAPVWQPMLQPVWRWRRANWQRWPRPRSQAARWLCRKQVPREHWPARRRRRRRRRPQSAPRPRPGAALLRERLSSAATEASSERRCAVERSCARSADVSVGALLSTRAAKLSFPGDGAALGGGGAWKDRVGGSDVTLNTGGLSIFHLSYRQQGPGHPGFQKIPFNFNGL